ncbi:MULTISPECIES: hypothetical protein [unclassified Paenibacillus]|uniref:hypothetical protein n=1 Tax=unclassified Paenibacillus TaxID=185978 RepID=UPI00364312BA
MNKLTISIFVLIVLIACSKSSPSENTITVKRSAPTDPAVTMNAPLYKNVPFSVTMFAPVQLKSNEEFTIEATLKNIIDVDLNMRHAAGVFYFSIKDSNGKRINTFVMPMVGISRTMPGQGEITEQYKYKLDKPGYYEVSAIAKFSIGEGEKTKDYELKTNIASIEFAE